MVHSESLELAGRTLTIETGKVAWQASGAVTIRYGDTIALATVVASKEPRPNIDFFPLTCDFEEKLYAAGKIPGGYIKREGRPSTDAILASRLTDRPLRPLFPKGFRNDVQVVVTPLSVDQENDPDILSIIGASAALTISDIPFDGPVGAVRMGYIDGELVVNPLQPRMAESKLDLVMAATRDAIVMVEAGAKEVPEDVILEALLQGHEQIKAIIDMQERLRQASGKEKREFPLKTSPEELTGAVRAYVGTRLHDNLVHQTKHERESAVDALENEVQGHFEEQGWEPADVKAVFDSLVKKTVREMILKENVRPDGRSRTEIRPLSFEVGLLPRVHGSGLFSRGQTQALTIATLGSTSDEQIIDGLGVEESKRYMHHYNFPPFSTGEARPLRSPGRREIGHGMLAERALEAVIPSQDEFPYTIRVVSEILSSNGSTSMAATTGSTLALMDAGVPIKSPVSGIAMGLITDDSGNYAILTDIQGVEDALGDMDFKVTGTREGVTAIQMDIKVSGLTRQIMAEALHQAREARLVILDGMSEVISGPRPELSPYAPRITRIQINPDKIGTVIGPGGKMIKKIIEETKASIDIEDDGSVFIASNDSSAAQKATDMIRALTAEVEVGQTYNGTVKRIMDFGAFVEVLPGKEGLVHISQLATHRVNRVEDVVNLGDRLEVKVTGIDSMGRINLSHRALLEPDGGTPDGEGRAPDGGGRTGGPGRPDRGGFRRDRDRGDRRPFEPNRGGGPRGEGGYRRDRGSDGGSEGRGNQDQSPRGDNQR
ncbi:MAG TPA: polyribonucleotide nucleotidyltransferase [Chloroflexota bacterium]